MRKFTKEEFCAWLAEQGDREFDPWNDTNCAMTQFGREFIPEVVRSCSFGYSYAPELKGVLFDHNKKVLGHIDLTYAEMDGIINSHTFFEALQRITS